MRVLHLLTRLENGIIVVAFLLAILLPLPDAVGRLLPWGRFHIPGNSTYLQQLTLWLAFLGGLLAVREGKHLTLSTAEVFGEGTRARHLVQVLAMAVAAAVTSVLAYGVSLLVMGLGVMFLLLGWALGALGKARQAASTS